MNQTSDKKNQTPDKKQRRKYKQRRFGNVPGDILGNLTQLNEIKFPDITKMFSPKGNRLIYFKINNIQDAAEKISEIYRNAIDEMAGIHYGWHHDPNEIVKRVSEGNWAFYGVKDQHENLISVTSMYASMEMHYIQWVWGCVDPNFRGMGVWEYNGVYLDEICEKSGATYGRVWCATTHDLSQKCVESAGYSPHSIDLEILGGSDGKFYFQNVVFYKKVYREDHILSCDNMVLTPRVEKLRKSISCN